MTLNNEDRAQLRQVAGLLGKAEQVFGLLSPKGKRAIRSSNGNAAGLSDYLKLARHGSAMLMKTTAEPNKSARTFHRTLLLVEVLSEEPLHPEIELSSVAFAITDGDCSGDVDRIDEAGITGQEMAELLALQCSDPSFFRLTDEGMDDEDVI